MSRYGSDDSDRRIARALIVGQYHDDADALDYLRQTSRADDGRRVADD